jgi:hypothetical protein
MWGSMRAFLPYIVFLCYDKFFGFQSPKNRPKLVIFDKNNILFGGENVIINKPGWFDTFLVFRSDRGWDRYNSCKNEAYTSNFYISVI